MDACVHFSRSISVSHVTPSQMLVRVEVSTEDTRVPGVPGALSARKF